MFLSSHDFEAEVSYSIIHVVLTLTSFVVTYSNRYLNTIVKVETGVLW